MGRSILFGNPHFQSCILTDFSWTTLLAFPDIMTGSPSHSYLCSLIFEVRTVIFGQNDLYPYVGWGFDCHPDLKKLHFDRFFMDHPLRFSRYNDWVADAGHTFFRSFLNLGRSSLAQDLSIYWGV